MALAARHINASASIALASSMTQHEATTLFLAMAAKMVGESAGVLYMRKGARLVRRLANALAELRELEQSESDRNSTPANSDEPAACPLSLLDRGLADPSETTGDAEMWRRHVRDVLLLGRAEGSWPTREAALVAALTARRRDAPPSPLLAAVDAANVDTSGPYTLRSHGGHFQWASSKADPTNFGTMQPIDEEAMIAPVRAALVLQTLRSALGKEETVSTFRGDADLGARSGTIDEDEPVSDFAHGFRLF